MHRLIDYSARPAGCSRGRFGVGLPALVVLALVLALPAAASAATQTLTVEKEGTGAGTVTSSPAGIECGGTCAAPFTEGSTVLLKGTAGANTAAVKWSGCAKVNLENECSVTMSAAKTVTATFNLLERPLSLSKKGGGTGTVTSEPAGIECGATCSANFVKGTTVTLTGTPGAKTLPPVWSGCDSVTAEGKCVVTMSVARSVTVTFDLFEYPLSVSKKGLGTGTVTSEPAGIECGATCSASFTTGSLVKLTGAPGVNTDPAVQWSGCDSVDGEGKCLVTLSAATSVIATFNLVKHQLTVVEPGTGTGTVISAPAGVSCGATCQASYAHGAKVTLTATPGLHSQPAKWAGCDETTKEGKCVVTMSSAREVTATFDLEPQYVQYTVSVGFRGTGTGSIASFPPGISCPPDCSESYVFKTPVTLFATAGTGSEFFRWSGGTCSGSAPCERKINSDRTVNAIFTAVGNRPLTVSKAGSGSGIVTSKPAGIECGQACSAELDASTKVVLKAVAIPGSTFSGWSGEGCSGTGTCRVRMNEARNVTASFAKNPSSPEARCRVPRLRGKTLAGARRALSAAHCALGKVRKPGGKGGRLVVRSSRPGAGATLPAGTRIKLRLVRKG